MLPVGHAGCGEFNFTLICLHPTQQKVDMHVILFQRVRLRSTLCTLQSSPWGHNGVFFKNISKTHVFLVSHLAVGLEVLCRSALFQSSGQNRFDIWKLLKRFLLYHWLSLTLLLI